MNEKTLMSIAEKSVFASAAFVGAALIYTTIASRKMDKMIKESTERMEAHSKKGLFDDFSPEAKRVLFGRNEE